MSTWEELVAEAGAFGAEMIARAHLKQIRAIKARPGGSGQASVEVHVARGTVQNVLRLEKHSEKDDQRTS